MNWRRFIRSPRRHVLTMKATHSLNRALLFRRDASRYASPAHLYCASGMAFLRGCYHQILGPRRHLPKFANGLCSHSDVWVHLHPHLIWQATKSYVERGNAFGLISHKGFLTARYRQLTAGTPYNLSTLPATGRRPIRSGRPYCLLLQRTAGPYMGAIRVERARSRRSITLCEAARSVHARLSQHRLRWHSNAHFRPPRQSVGTSIRESKLGLKIGRRRSDATVPLADVGARQASLV
jgi:hypothetical protein